MTQSIIVYRNPLEQAFWETLVTSDYSIPIFLAAVSFIIAMVAFNSLFWKIAPKMLTKMSYHRKQDVSTKFAFAAAGFVAVVVFNFFKV